MARKLALVTRTAPGADPSGMPVGLGVEGAALWARVTAEYDVTDSGGATMLEMACRALDRSAECAARIAVDGPVVEVRGGPPRPHPLLRTELDNRAFAVRTLQKLGLNFEPVRSGPDKPPTPGFLG